MTEQQIGQPITLNIRINADALNFILTELSKPIDPVVNLIRDIRAQALTQLEDMRLSAEANAKANAEAAALEQEGVAE